ncbi:MAG: RNHCP domain-containing protein [bacterium]|nr:RNHCP domain-containing protein [bacterium]
MSDTRFKRTVEDFLCEQCGFAVKGSGYTNHCPACLWSKHVDVHPGDRLALCRGLMEPVAFEQERGKFVILHKCQKCGMQKKNKVDKNDDLSLMSKGSL